MSIEQIHKIANQFIEYKAAETDRVVELLLLEHNLIRGIRYTAKNAQRISQILKNKGYSLHILERRENNGYTVEVELLKIEGKKKLFFAEPQITSL